LDRPRLSVVIPCYNEEACLHELHRRVSAAAREAAGASHEIVLINDGSKRRSWAVMQELSRRDSRVVAINLSRNHGHQLALTAGLDLCAGERILIIDADLQDPPELLSAMMAEMDRHQADVVYAVRRARSGETAFKKATAKLFYRLLDKLTDVDIPLDTGDFRLMSRRALDAFLSLPEQARFIRGMVSWVGFRQIPFAYDRQERFSGATKYPLRKMIAFAWTRSPASRPRRCAWPAMSACGWCSPPCCCSSTSPSASSPAAPWRAGPRPCWWWWCWAPCRCSCSA
jgi:glycosyltransferase involved in cell wall biosynthesis